MKKLISKLTIVCLAFILGSSTVSASTPPGLNKKGGLPPGIQKRFIQQEKNTKEYYTVVKDIYSEQRRIVIEDGTAILNLLVADKAKIEINKKSAKFEDIRINDEVYFKLDKNNTITELKITREKETVYTVEGTLLLVNKEQNQLYIYENNKLVTYQLKSDVVVRVNGERRQLSDLIPGMKLKITIEGNKVKLIEGTKDVETKVKGTIIGIDYNRLEFVLQEGTKVTLYKAKSSTPIKIDGKIKTFNDLVVGMEIEAYTIEQNIVSLEGKALATESQKGIVQYINVDRKEIILTQGSKETLFKINNNVTVKINGVLKALKDITVNMEAQLTIQNGEVIEININPTVTSVEGRIIAKDVSSKPSITVQIGNEIKVFTVKSEVNIVEVEVGREAIINIKDKQVISIVMK